MKTEKLNHLSTNFEALTEALYKAKVAAKDAAVDIINEIVDEYGGEDKSIDTEEGNVTILLPDMDGGENASCVSRVYKTDMGLRFDTNLADQCSLRDVSYTAIITLAETLVEFIEENE